MIKNYLELLNRGTEKIISIDKFKRKLDRREQVLHSKSRVDSTCLVSGGGVTFENEKISDPDFEVTSKDGILKAGEKKFAKIVFQTS